MADPKVKRVFISYAREDRGYAERLFRDLRRAGVDPWLDSESLLPGQKWKTEISSAIRRSDFFLALLSSRSLSKRGYVQKELRQALEILDETPESETYLIPVRLEECWPTHPKLLEINWLDLFPVYESGLRKLLLTVQPPSSIVPTPAFESISDAVDREDLAQTGWGAIMPHDLDLSIREYLAPLLRHRQAQASGNRESLFREFLGTDGYQPGESALDFLARHGAGPGLPTPGRVPYYLLIVGSPEQIPFSFEYGLGHQYRVGRIHFDSPEEYQNYSMSLVVAETQRANSKTVALLGAENRDDHIKTAVAGVIPQLAEFIRHQFPDWRVDNLLGDLAIKQGLLRLLSSESPTLLFIMAHGLVFSPGHPRERAEQGAIVCSDWLGPSHTMLPEYYFSAADVPEVTNLLGTIVFYLGSMSAGTSWKDEINLTQRQGARAFVSALPKRLLGCKRGALAFIGHINDIYFGMSQEGFGASQIKLHEEAFRSLLSGRRVGAALQSFRDRYVDLASALSLVLQEASVDGKADKEHLALLYQSAVDVRNYVIVGDPAARPTVNGYAHAQP